MEKGTALWCAAAALAVAGVAAAQEKPEGVTDDEATVEVQGKVEKKVEFTFSYFVKTHGHGKDVAKKAAKPASKTVKAVAGKEAPVKEQKPAEAPKPALSVEQKGGKVIVTRANILVNRTIDLGVTMDVYGRELRLTEFVKASRAEVDVVFDTIDVVSTIGGLESGEYTLVYFDVDGEETYHGQVTIK